MTGLLELRKNKKMSQHQLADIFEVSQKTISAWERGYRTPKAKEMQKIEDYFGVPKEKIFFVAFGYSK